MTAVLLSTNLIEVGGQDELRRVGESVGDLLGRALVQVVLAPSHEFLLRQGKHRLLHGRGILRLALLRRGGAGLASAQVHNPNPQRN